MQVSDNKRANRVAQILQQELAHLCLHELKDPRVGFVTITEVMVSKDLKTARIYVAVLGNDATAEQQACIGLEAASGFLRQQLGKRLNLRYVPLLHFVLDTSSQKAQRLQILLAADRPGAVPEIETALPVPAPRVPLDDALNSEQNFPKSRKILRRRRKVKLQ